MSDDLIDILRADPVFRKRVNRLLKMEKKDEKWIDQLEDLHVSRATNAVSTSALLSNSKRISVQSNVDNQAVRSSCVGIRIKAMRQLLVIEESVDYLNKYVMNRYHDELKTHKTLADKRSAVAFALNSVNKLVKRLDFVVKLADVIIADCDAAGFSNKRIVDSLNIQARDH